MKIKNVVLNNRKHAFDVTIGKHTFSFPFSRLRLKPTSTDPIEIVFADPELGFEGFTYQLHSGKEDSVPVDAVLDYIRDPDYLRQQLLFKLTINAQRQLAQKKISKREIIRRLGTSPAQFYRLMDQTNTRKSLDQMVKLLAVLDCSVDLVFAKAA